MGEDRISISHVMVSCQIMYQERSKTRLLVPKMLTFPSELTKQCGVVLAMVDIWHHLAHISVEVLGYSGHHDHLVPVN